MTQIEPIYQISAIIRYGIVMLNDTRFNQEIKTEVVKEIQKRLAESANKLTQQEVELVMSYLGKIASNLGNIENNFLELGLKPNISKDEYNELQLFVGHILKDYEYNLVPDLEIINTAIKVVNIAKEEIASFLPPVLDSDDGVVLRKVSVSDIAKNTNK